MEYANRLARTDLPRGHSLSVNNSEIWAPESTSPNICYCECCNEDPFLLTSVPRKMQCSKMTYPTLKEIADKYIADQRVAAVKRQAEDGIRYCGTDDVSLVSLGKTREGWEGKGRGNERGRRRRT